MTDAWDPLAEAVVVAYCGWNPLVPTEDATQRLWGDGSTLLALPCLNVTAISQITSPDMSDPTAPDVVIDPSEYRWRTNGVLLSSYGTWIAGGSYTAGGWIDGQPYDVTYSGGYTNPPDDLVAVLGSLTKRVDRLDLSSARLGSAAFGYNSAAAGGGLLLVEQMVLDRYRILKVA